VAIDPEATATVATVVTRGGRPITSPITQPSSPSSSSSPTGSSPGSATSGQVTTPSEALHVDEARRMAMLAGFGSAVCVFAALALLPMEGNQTAKIAHGVALLLAGVLSFLVMRYLRTPDRYRTWLVSAYAAPLGLALSTGFVFWGVYSSAVLFVVIVMYFFSGTKSYWPALVTLLSCGLPHLVLGVFTSLGAMNDVGVVRAFVLRPYEKLAVVLIAQFAFVVTFLLARMTRRSITEAVEQLDGAVRGLAKREALLAEAKQDLERALQVGGPGLYTEQTLGSYRLGYVIGRGAMGEVYEATHNTTGERAAVKVLTPASGSNPALVHRFLREVEIAASLESPNVVRVLEIPQGTSTLPYLAMELLDGESLSELLRETPRFKVKRVVAMMAELSNGIEAAHQAGIIHRDLKPRNLFLHKEGGRRVWKILDFGVSKLAGQAGTLTKGHLVGTPSYMAPEQARGLEVDPRADVYALGVVAYRALTGRPAFSGPDVPSILYAVTHDMPPCPSDMTKLPEAVNQVLAISIAKKPELRFERAPELAAALAKAAKGTISDDLVARAEKVLKEHPWGHRG
jgi:serine/threonine-protein kinase